MHTSIHIYTHIQSCLVVGFIIISFETTSIKMELSSEIKYQQRCTFLSYCMETPFLGGYK